MFTTLPRIPGACLAALVSILSYAPAHAATADWPQWRGPNRDAISSETGLLKTWPTNGPPLLWKTTGLGGGFSSVAIVGDRLYTLGNRRGKDGGGTHLLALQLADGKPIWATAFPAGEGKAGSPNGTPTIDGELAYAISLNGTLVCARTTTGEIVWSKNFSKDFEGGMMSGWGFSESPLVDGDKLIVTPGGTKSTIVALNKKNGELLWKCPVGDVGGRGKDGSAYTGAVVSEGAGVRQYIQLLGRGVVGVRASDGKLLWSYNRVANGTANIPTPLVKGDYVFCSTGYGTGGGLLKLVPSGDQGVNAEEVYFLNAKDFQNHHGGMILVGDHLYAGHGHNNGFPICLELKTGKVAWGKDRGPGTGSAAILYADGHLYFRYENAVLALIEATPEGYREKGAFELASKNGKSWSHPVIHKGLLYLRDQDNLLCYDVRAK